MKRLLAILLISLLALSCGGGSDTKKVTFCTLTADGTWNEEAIVVKNGALEKQPTAPTEITLSDDFKVNDKVVYRKAKLTPAAENIWTDKEDGTGVAFDPTATELDESKKVYASYRIYSNIRICACGDYESDVPCAKFENIDTTAGIYQCLIDKFALYTDEAKNEDDYDYYAYIDTDTYDRMRFTSHTFTDLSGIYGTNPAMVMNLGSSSEWSEADNKHLALFENKDDIEGDLPSSTIAPSNTIKDNEPDKDYIILYIHCS